ncbi:MAG: hypothetical protein QW667_05090 [Candidatus Bathyarchaeia archaeon]
MAVFEIETWLVREGKLKEQESIMKNIFEYGKRHPEISKYVKSLRFFRQGIGGKPVGRFVLITEFESLADMEKFYKLLQKDAEWLKIKEKWMSIINLNSMHVSLWNDQLRNLWIETR